MPHKGSQQRGTAPPNRRLNMTKIAPDQIVIVRNQKVRVIATDSDATANQLGVLVSDADTAVWFLLSEVQG